ncbi:MAG: DUF3048 domain-containing protein [Candidatus Paceibacterota bacterium]
MDKKVVVITAILIYFISGYFSYAYFSDGGSVTSLVKPAEKYKPPTAEGVNGSKLAGPKTEKCPLNGEKLTKGHRKLWESRRPLGVMIENHEDARPQSGLSSADIIHEAVAEGGITRFLVIFYCKDAKFVGPIRSARVYFLDMLRGYGEYPLYVHVGGANTPGPADALGMIRKLGWDGYNDMNQFSVAFPYFYRDYDRNPGVATEHTMYSSTQKLWKYAKEKRKLTEVDEDGALWDESFEPWEFIDGDPVSNPTKKISYEFWEGKDPYSVTWKYDLKTNSYLRFHGDGKAHTDKNTGKQLAPKNVVVVFMRESAAQDGYKGQHLLYGTTGTGKAIVFQNGDVIEGTWSKRKETSTLILKDSSGSEIKFVRGQIWISMVPTGVDVNY